MIDEILLFLAKRLVMQGGVSIYIYIYINVYRCILGSVWLLLGHSLH